MKNESIAFRVSEQQKDEIKKASDKQNRSVSDFTRINILIKAKEVLEDAE